MISLSLYQQCAVQILARRYELTAEKIAELLKFSVECIEQAMTVTPPFRTITQIRGTCEYAGQGVIGEKSPELLAGACMSDILKNYAAQIAVSAVAWYFNVTVKEMRQEIGGSLDSFVGARRAQVQREVKQIGEPAISASRRILLRVNMSQFGLSGDDVVALPDELRTALGWHDRENFNQTFPWEGQQFEQQRRAVTAEQRRLAEQFIVQHPFSGCLLDLATALSIPTAQLTVILQDLGYESSEWGAKWGESRQKMFASILRKLHLDVPGSRLTAVQLAKLHMWRARQIKKPLATEQEFGGLTEVELDEHLRLPLPFETRLSAGFRGRGSRLDTATRAAIVQFLVAYPGEYSLSEMRDFFLLAPSCILKEMDRSLIDRDPWRKPYQLNIERLPEWGGDEPLLPEEIARIQLLIRTWLYSVEKVHADYYPSHELAVIKAGANREMPWQTETGRYAKRTTALTPFVSKVVDRYLSKFPKEVPVTEICEYFGLYQTTVVDRINRLDLDPAGWGKKFRTSSEWLKRRRDKPTAAGRELVLASAMV